MSAGGSTVPTAAALAPPAGLARIGRLALAVGVGGVALSAVGGFFDPAQFFRSYLVAFVYWVSIPLGCFGIAMLHHLTGGAWGLMIRRILEAAGRTLPLAALFFVPLAFGLGSLYKWAKPEAVAKDHLLQHQAAYLNAPFFIARTAAYFAIWCGLAWILSRMSRRQDETGDAALVRRMQVLSGPGLALYGLTVTFAAIDWLMSLDSHWFSSIYGFYVGGGQAIAALGFVILVAVYLAAHRPMAGLLRPAHFHDYGKLLLAFVVIWAYFSASQLIIIYQGNLAEEASWYQGRMFGAWKWVSLLLVLLHFALPFLLLLARDTKRSLPRLASIAVLLLVMRWVDLHWLAAPAFSPERVAYHWLDLTIPLGLGGLWVGAFARELRRRPLLPYNDPHLREALAHE